MQDLERDAAAEQRIGREQHDAHAAFAELRQDLEAADFRSGRRGCGRGDRAVRGQRLRDAGRCGRFACRAGSGRVLSSDPLTDVHASVRYGVVVRRRRHRVLVRRAAMREHDGRGGADPQRASMEHTDGGNGRALTVRVESEPDDSTGPLQTIVALIRRRVDEWAVIQPARARQPTPAERETFKQLAAMFESRREVARVEAVAANTQPVYGSGSSPQSLHRRQGSLREAL